MQKEERLVWLDMEMTGLDPDRDRILEVAAIVTDGKLKVDLEGGHHFQKVAFCQQNVLSRMDAWCQGHHGRSGLVYEVLRSDLSVNDVERGLLFWLRDHKGFEPGTAVLAGNTIHFDRRFIARWMPDLHEFLHYRMLDVTSIREAIARTTTSHSATGDFARRVGEIDTDEHRALADVETAIKEAAVYWEHLKNNRLRGALTSALDDADAGSKERAAG